ncbi:hypothetical protein AWZ03_015147, partial [Drosophila navojoa]
TTSSNERHKVSHPLCCANIDQSVCNAELQPRHLPNLQIERSQSLLRIAGMAPLEDCP